MRELTVHSKNGRLRKIQAARASAVSTGAHSTIEGGRARVEAMFRHKMGKMGDLHRCSKETAEHASVTDREASSRHVLDGKFTISSLKKGGYPKDPTKSPGATNAKLTFLPSSATAFSSSINPILSAFRITGVTNPFGVLTATLRST